MYRYKSSTAKSNVGVTIPFKGKVLAAYDRSADNLPNIILVGGSALDFRTPTTTPATTTTTSSSSIGENVGCIVNAANEGCLGGGGIDGAISLAGGQKLAYDRLQLPILFPHEKRRTAGNSTNRNTRRHADKQADIRCQTGSAVITGPAVYGKLHVPFVIHAVGPDFNNYKTAVTDSQELQNGYHLLRSAYHKSLDIATATSNTTMPITHIAFCLLSAGVYCGTQPLERIVECGLLAISDWRPMSAAVTPKSIHAGTSNGSTITSTITLQENFFHLKEIYVFAYTERECEILVQCGEAVFQSST